MDNEEELVSISLRLKVSKKKAFQKRLIDCDITMQDWFDSKVDEELASG